MTNKKRQRGNPRVRIPPPRQGAMQKQVREKMKRIFRKPHTPRGR